MAKNLNKVDEDIDQDVVKEFGGPIGVTCLMIMFPILMCYFSICLYDHDAQIKVPDLIFWSNGLPKLKPTILSAKLYLGFVMLQAFTAVTMPGIKVKGFPVQSLDGKQLSYLCNGISTWYFDLVLLFLLHKFDVLPITIWVENLRQIQSVSMVFSIAVTFLTYFWTICFGKAHRMSGNFAYDLFMGAPLHPRIGNLDFKMWSEIRIPW